MALYANSIITSVANFTYTMFYNIDKIEKELDKL